MKLIFLDIDGVLNYQLYYQEKRQCDRHKELPEDAPDGAHDICERRISLLNDLIEDTGAKVVISSSWRNGKSVEELTQLFEYKGFKGEIIGKTPYLWFGISAEQEYHYSVPRGCEIKAWLELNKDKLSEKMSEVRYVIFDDDSDMLYWQRDKFLWVDPYAGLTPSLIYKATKILGKIKK